MVFATVSDPKTEGTQTKYLVTIHESNDAASPSAEPEERKVYHRYSEFQWLYDRLIKERRGAVIPIAGLRFGIAGKAGVSPIGTGNVDDTVAGRCRRLDTFMRDVSSNPELQGTPSLEIFLTNGTGVDFDAAKAKAEADSVNESSDDEAGDGGKAGDVDASTATPPPPKSSSKAKRTGFRQYVAKTVAKTATAVAARGGKTKLYETQDEERIQIAIQYVKDLEIQVKSMALQASTLNRSGMESAVAWADFGRAAGLWAEVQKSRQTLEDAGGPKLMSEGKDNVRGSVSVTVTDEKSAADDPPLENKCARLGAIEALSIKAAAKMTDTVNQSKEKFTESVQDLLAVVSALKVALHKRNNCQLMCTSRIQHASKLSAQTSADSKETEKAEKDAEEAKQELEQATKRFLREMERVDTDLDRRLCRAMGEYAQLQLEMAEGMREVWLKMINMSASASDVNGGDATQRGKEEERNILEEAVEVQLPSAPPPPEPSAPPLE